MEYIKNQEKKYVFLSRGGIMTKTEEQNQFSGVPPPCKREDRQTGLCNVIFIMCVPKSEICRQSPSGFFFQREAHVTGFTGGFFIEEPDRPFVMGLSDIKTMNYKI